MYKMISHVEIRNYGLSKYGIPLMLTNKIYLELMLIGFYYSKHGSVNNELPSKIL